MSEPVKTELKNRGQRNRLWAEAVNDSLESEVTIFQSSPSNDSGNLDDEVYKKKLSPFRYYLRKKGLAIVKEEQGVLENIQKKFRNPFLDFYFAWSANLASHTFYVLILPLPFWLGLPMITRDLVQVLGLGIYFSGCLKDYMCLPRPRSPPLYRITMSSYTTKEYGLPSSHSANATAATLVFLWRLIENKESFSSSMFVALFIFSCIYYFSLILGRVYCGMHGFLDLASGATIGLILFLLRFFIGDYLDNIMLYSFNDSWKGLIIRPLIEITFYVLLIHWHVEPVDDCPCFDDSVAFIGVLIGLDISQGALIAHLGAETKAYSMDLLKVPLDFGAVGISYLLLRIIIGMLLVVAWKAASKPAVFTILPPIYKFVGWYIPRKSYEPTAFSRKSTKQIRSQSLSNIEKDKIMTEIDGIIHGFRYNVNQEEADPYSSSSQENESDKTGPVGGVFRPRYDVEIVGRLIIYAGISSVAIGGYMYAINFLGKLFNGIV